MFPSDVVQWKVAFGSSEDVAVKVVVGFVQLTAPSGPGVEIVKGPLRRGSRDEIERLSGQRAYPVIEFEDGRVFADGDARCDSSIGGSRVYSGGDAVEVVRPADDGEDDHRERVGPRVGAERQRP